MLFLAADTTISTQFLTSHRVVTEAELPKIVPLWSRELYRGGTPESRSQYIAVLIQVLADGEYFVGDGRSTLSQAVSRIRAVQALRKGRNQELARAQWVSSTVMVRQLQARYFTPGKHKEACSPY